MKKFLILFFILAVSTLNVVAQKGKFFNNSNNELCLYLYERGDQLGSYMVFMVVEDLNENDIKMLDQWETLDQDTKTKVTQRWTAEGKRIEVQRSPYITYPPVFPKDLKPTKLVKVAPADTLNDNLWKMEPTFKKEPINH